MLQFAAKTHSGLRRKTNEDALLANDAIGLFVVADGVGGRAAGEVASALTIETFKQAGPKLRNLVERYARDPDWNGRNRVLEGLDEVCQEASARVYEEAESSSRRGMTTTLVVALVGGGAAFLAHVGDSRAYLVREGLIRQLTEDHSMVNDLVRSGQMTWDEARVSRYRNVITRAIGLYPNVQADLMSIEILPGDRILISSDGLSDPVPSEKIEEIACQNDVQTAAIDLVDAALDGGGPDNITVVLVEPEATPETESARARAQVMQDLFLFQGLPFHARLRVSRICRNVKFGPGQVLVSDGDRGDSMYVIAQGQVSVSHNGMELATLSAGEHFGELGLLEDQDRTATVTGLTHGLALVIERADLRDFTSREPALGNALLWRLLQTLGQRLRVTNTLATSI